MQSLKKSKLTQAMLAFAIIGALCSALLWEFALEGLAVFVAIATLGILISFCYWRLRVASMQLMRKSLELRDSHSGLHGRVNAQLNSLSSGVRGQLKQVEKSLTEVSNQGPGGIDSKTDERISIINDQVTQLSEKLSGQQEVLHEILIALDLRALDTRYK